MQRACFTYLNDWLVSPQRKPLVIRGARQVGKTWLVRQLAKFANKQLLEIIWKKRLDWQSFLLLTIQTNIIKLGSTLQSTN